MFYRSPAAEQSGRVSRLKKIVIFVVALAGLSLCALAQSPGGVSSASLNASGPVELRVKNRTGRVTVAARRGAEAGLDSRDLGRRPRRV